MGRRRSHPSYNWNTPKQQGAAVAGAVAAAGRHGWRCAAVVHARKRKRSGRAATGDDVPTHRHRAAGRRDHLYLVGHNGAARRETAHLQRQRHGTAGSTTVTFYAAGTYVFTATLTDATGNVAANTRGVLVGQVATTTAVTPSSASVPASRQQTLGATCYDQFGNAMVSYGFYGPAAYGLYDNWIGAYGVAVPLSAFTWASPAAAAWRSVTATTRIASTTRPRARRARPRFAHQRSWLAGDGRDQRARRVRARTTGGLTAAPDATNPTGQIDLSWTAVSGATGYNIYHGAAPGGESSLLNSSPGQRHNLSGHNL